MIAFALELEGWRGYEPSSWGRSAITLCNGKKVQQKDIPKYFNDTYIDALVLYNRYTQYGLPWGATTDWADHPEWVLNLIECFIVTKNAWDDKQINGSGRTTSNNNSQNSASGAWLTAGTA